MVSKGERKGRKVYYTLRTNGALKDLIAYEAPFFLPLKDPEVPRRTSWFSEGPLGTFIS